MSTITTTAIVHALPTAGMIAVVLAGTDAPISIPAARSVSALAAVGDQVIVTMEDRQRWATAILGVSKAVDESVSSSGGIAGPENNVHATGTNVFRPLWANTWDGSWRDDLPDVGCGAAPQWGVMSIRSGGIWYGNSLRSVGTITSAYLTITRHQGGIYAAQTIPMRLLAGASIRPTVYPMVLDAASGPSLGVGQTGDWWIPAAWLNRLGPGGDAGGIGIGNSTASPYVRISPPPIIVNWKR